MKTKTFHVDPKAVLRGAMETAAVVATVTLDAEGRLAVFGSDSTPITLALLRQGIDEIAALAAYPA